MKKVINLSNGPKPLGPYSHAVMTGNILFVSGQIPMDPKTGKLYEGEIAGQTKQVMENIQGVLNEAGMNFSNIVKSSVFLADMNDFDIVNETYAAYFSEDPPARECIQAASFPKNARIEISVIASQ